jgi:hypothetical protein
VINRAELVATSLVGEVTSPVLGAAPYDVAADGTPFVPVGAGGVCYTVKVGMRASGWVADQVEPGVSLANPDDAANEALLLYACIGNRATVRTGMAAGATGVVTGKHEAFRLYKHLLVHLDDAALDLVAPGDVLVVRACGRGVRVEGLPEIACHSLGPELWDAWAPRVSERTLAVRVATVLPPEVVGMGSGRASGITSVALQADAAAELGELRIGDVVAIRDWDATYVTGYQEGRLLVAVVGTGDSPVLGNGAAATILLSGPADVFDLEVDASANIATILSLG